MTVRIVHVGEDGGVSWSWVGEERTLLVYDDYPADYPAVAGSATVDKAMRMACTPSAIAFGEPWSDGDGSDGAGRQVGVTVYFDQLGARPVAGAFRVDVLPVDGADPVGTFDLVVDEFHATERTRTLMGATLRLSATGPEPDALLAGEIRLVLRPSREVALRDAILERYWGGTIDVVVPTRTSTMVTPR